MSGCDYLKAAVNKLLYMSGSVFIMSYNFLCYFKKQQFFVAKMKGNSLTQFVRFFEGGSKVPFL